ncbi:MAG: branched-chain amino acid transport system substrate-binding protein [Bacteriovoracaceae bacterium]
MRKVLLFLFFLGATASYARDFNLYLDADLTTFKASGVSIQRGIQVALDEFNAKNNKDKINLITLDHRGNTRRSLLNFKKMLEDKNALGIFGGMHSPPLITNNKFINDNKILTFVSWAAGAPITRSKTKENWIYRLSIDDSQAGEYISKYAVKEKGCKSPYLLLENTPWGKSNLVNMNRGLKKFGVKPSDKKLFGWGISKSASSQVTESIIVSKADCIFFVGNASDAKRFFNSFGVNKLQIPIYSHWGITGGDNKSIAKVINDNKLDVSIIQTNFSFSNKKQSMFHKRVKENIKKKYNYTLDQEIRPVSGWVHSYDLTLLFLKSFQGLDSSGEITHIRQLLKDNLENLKNPTQGLIKKYLKPFSKYSKENKNAHEALDKNDYTMKKYSDSGDLM